MPTFTPANAVFAIIAFEGPDQYSRAGGLGVRVRDLAHALAEEGFRTHLYFIGDPSLPSIEQQGNLTLHRWGQWISAYHPGSVYDGEVQKLQDMAGSLPPVLVDDVVIPAAIEGKVTVVMTEDWQTVPTMVNIGRLLRYRDLAHRVVPVWTANNIFGFDGIDWGALQYAAQPMTVSRYMKLLMTRWNVNALVTPNGITPNSIVNVPAATARKLRKAFGSEVATFKIGRFSPDKRWMMAMEAMAILKHTGTWTRILVRGDKSSYGREVLYRAQTMGLSVANLTDRFTTVDELAAAISSVPEDVLNITSFLPDEIVPPIYAAVDGVLANSGHEPFGLVGLEVMGAGGLAYVGSTGEQYAEADRNAVVLDTDDPREIVVQIRRLQGDPERARALKRAGKATAKAYLWSHVLCELFTRLEYVALVRGVEVNG